MLAAGSPPNFISFDTTHNLNKDEVHIQRLKLPFFVSTANKSRSMVDQVVNLKFKIGDKSFQSHFDVVDWLNTDVLLGTYVLDTHEKDILIFVNPRNQEEEEIEKHKKL